MALRIDNDSFSYGASARPIPAPLKKNLTATGSSFTKGGNETLSELMPRLHEIFGNSASAPTKRSRFTKFGDSDDKNHEEPQGSLPSLNRERFACVLTTLKKASDIISADEPEWNMHPKQRRAAICRVENLLLSNYENEPLTEPSFSAPERKELALFCKALKKQ